MRKSRGHFQNSSKLWAWHQQQSHWVVLEHYLPDYCTPAFVQQLCHKCLATVQLGGRFLKGVFARAKFLLLPSQPCPQASVFHWEGRAQGFLSFPGKIVLCKLGGKQEPISRMLNVVQKYFLSSTGSPSVLSQLILYLKGVKLLFLL